MRWSVRYMRVLAAARTHGVRGNRSGGSAGCLATVSEQCTEGRARGGGFAAPGENWAAGGGAGKYRDNEQQLKREWMDARQMGG